MPRKFWMALMITSLVMSIAWEGPEVKDSYIWQQFRRYILSEQTQTSNRCIDTDIL